MTNEFEILKNIDSMNTITQRELAKKTGLSLGAVNVLIKRLIHKGLLKIEHINARAIRYILTPKGLIEKAKLTYKYIILSYNHISNIENKIGQIIKNKRSFEKIILYGEKDELYEIILSKLQAMNEQYKIIDSVNELSMFNGEEFIIIVWNPELIEKGQQKNMLNILSAI